MQSNTRMYLLALALFAGGVGYLVWEGLAEYAVPHVGVAQALQMQPGSLTNVKLYGVVAAGSLRREDSGASAPRVAFSLRDADDAAKHVALHYEGPLPDTLLDGTEVYAEGSCAAAAPDGALTCRIRTLTTKCPSKYSKENRS